MRFLRGHTPLFLLPLFFLILLQACTNDGKPERAVFLWKNEQHLDAMEDARLDSLGVTHIYIKYADIAGYMV